MPTIRRILTITPIKLMVALILPYILLLILSIIHFPLAFLLISKLVLLQLFLLPLLFLFLGGPFTSGPDEDYQKTPWSFDDFFLLAFQIVLYYFIISFIFEFILSLKTTNKKKV